MTIPEYIGKWFDLALWLAGIGHFCILGASFQVPARLDWKTDLAKLKPFNKKLMWTYGGFTVLTIVAFGLLTLGLHDEFLRGDRAALGLAAFIGIFWAVRVAIDIGYFSHEDWPPGKAFYVGHILLMSLFITLAATYLGLVIWRLWLPQGYSVQGSFEESMSSLIPYIRIAGVVQLLIAGANIFIPSKLHYRENLPKVSLIVRQVFIVHHLYIVLTVIALGLLGLFYAPELARAEPLSRFLSGFIALFWMLRIPIQLFYYDPELKRKNFLGHILFSTMFLYLGAVFTVVVIGQWR